MYTSTPTRRFSRIATLGIITVALAVLGWGAQYKMSLYHRADSSSAMRTPAKLLTDRERPAEARASVVPMNPEHFRVDISFILFIVSLSLSLIQAAAAMRATQWIAIPGSLPATVFFFFRPPPAPTPSH